MQRTPPPALLPRVVVVPLPVSLQPQPAPSSHAVCNPATGKWVEVPEPIYAKGTFGLSYRQGMQRTCLVALAFDLAVPSTRFHVLQLVESY